MNNYKFPFLIAVLLCLIFGLFLYKADKELKNMKPTTIVVDSARVVAQNQRILELEEAMRLGLIEKTHLINKIAQQTKVKTQTVIVEKIVPIRTEKIIIIDSTKLDTTHFVRVPFDIVDGDSFYTLRAHVDTSYFTLDTLSVNNYLSIVVGEHKGKWWQKNTPMVEVKSSNPYTKIEVENVTIKQKKKFWQTAWFGGVVGALSMLLIL